VPTISTAARNAACNAIVDLIDAGSGAGTLKIYTGTSPGPGNAATGTLLATLTFSDPAFGNASTGTATANAITADSSADDDGTAGYARAEDSDGNDVIDLTVGTSGADLNLDSTAIVTGGTVSVTSCTVTVPAS
jgi:hypothetical protein